MLRRGGSRLGVFKDRTANHDTFIADVDARIVAGAGDELPDLVLGFTAEGASTSAVGRFFVSPQKRHGGFSGVMFLSR